MSDTKITPPAGAETYVDALGREQWRVTGPNGVFLVTASRGGSFFEVWRSDSLGTVARDRDLQQALSHAAYYANLPRV